MFRLFFLFCYPSPLHLASHGCLLLLIGHADSHINIAFFLLLYLLDLFWCQLSMGDKVAFIEYAQAA